ncbi:hypothetical protein N9K16_04435 [Alphaproteobacteria bacterium]|jgi:hypothetical protein|nr:hypothetical protein [Alphaproteobacteria bacterium]
MNHSKDDYILRRLSKIHKKKWELFVISRVIHKLDDLDVEFTTQQLVRRPDGSRALTDMYFPQFGIHLEIDEGQHLDKDHEEADKRRTEDIVSVTDHKVHRIAAAEKHGDKAVDRSLADVKAQTDQFIAEIRALKEQGLTDGSFEKWDFEMRYNPCKYIKEGEIDAGKNVIFRKQKDALTCFGYRGGEYQRGAWKIPDGSGDMVWFPRLYERDDWENEISHDGQVIIERAKHPKDQERTASNLVNGFDAGNRIVFARVKDVLGYTLYRYVGTFLIDLINSNKYEVKFDRIKTREQTRVLDNANHQEETS